MRKFFAASTASSPFITNLPTAGNAAYGGTAPTDSIFDTIRFLIQIVFSFLGVILLCLVLYAGFLWMTAAGDPKKVQKAKDILSQSVIGLVITLCAYGIAYYISAYAQYIGA